jgi:hypothetical protein
VSTTWDITGNAGTKPIQNFLGTSDAQPLIIQPTGNVGIGGRIPDDKFEVFTISNQYGITHTDGTVRLSTSVGDGGGIGTRSPHPLHLLVGGNPAMTIDTSGNVGIGTAPIRADKLRIRAETNRYGFTHTDGTITVGTFVGRLAPVGTQDGGGVGTQSNHPLSFYVNGIGGGPCMTITTNAHVGIGTLAPADKLQVQTAADNYGITHTDGTATVGTYIEGGFGGGFGTKSNHQLSLYVGANRSMTLATNGNVGVGTVAPQAKLDIAGGTTEGLHIATTNQTPYAVMMNNTTAGATDATGFGFWQSDTGIAVLTNHGNHAIGIDSSGNVGIGTTTTTPNTKLTIQGDVAVAGGINLSGDVVLTGADCAEEFDIAEAAEIEPGTVMVLDRDGALQQSRRAYDKRVAGVISGAGTYKPGLILDRRRAQDNRLPVALVGKVYCKVDACSAPIEVGDLLTTSSTPGHAMKAVDPVQAFGSVIGKALRPLAAGQGMIPILIALQ